MKMADERSPAAPVGVNFLWEARRESLRRCLTSFPDSEWSWLWQIRLRICTYLLRRYHDLPDDSGDVRARADHARSRLADTSGPIAIANPIHRVFPEAEQLRRIQIRASQCVVLERLAVVGTDARERAVRRAVLEEERHARFAGRRDRFERVVLPVLVGVAALLTISFVVKISLLSGASPGAISALLVTSSSATLAVIALVRVSRRGSCRD